MKKVMIAALSSGTGILAGGLTVGKVMQNNLHKKAEKVDKFKSYYNLLLQWLQLKQEGNSLETYFIKKAYKTIAIYGMGELGNRLYEELKGSSVEVKYGIDSNPSDTYAEIEVVAPEDDLQKVDAIIVTAIFAFDEVESKLSQATEAEIISLEDVVYEM